MAVAAFQLDGERGQECGVEAGGAGDASRRSVPAGNAVGIKAGGQETLNRRQATDAAALDDHIVAGQIELARRSQGKSQRWPGSAVMMRLACNAEAAQREASTFESMVSVSAVSKLISRGSGWDD